MIDSTNPRILADNIRHLSGEAGSQASDISTLQTTVTTQGNAIEALGTYSSDEIDTGMKFGDNTIYRKILTGTSPDEGNLDISLEYDIIINLYGFYIVGNNYVIISRLAALQGYNKTAIRLPAASASYQGVPFNIIVEYTKPNPAAPSPDLAPAPDDTRSIDPEPEVREAPEEEPIADEPIEEPVVEVKKTTRKKTTTTE